MMTIDRRLFYEIAKRSPQFKNMVFPRWRDIRECEKIWEETFGYEGCELWKIAMDLKDRGWNEKQILGFKIFYLTKGIEEGWLIDELLT